jgi:hypothetical protein
LRINGSVPGMFGFCDELDICVTYRKLENCDRLKQLLV